MQIMVIDAASPTSVKAEDNEKMRIPSPPMDVDLESDVQEIKVVDEERLIDAPLISSTAPKRPQSLSAFHQQRYGHFLQAYFGYMEAQRARCIRQAAQLCMIGIGNVKRSNGEAVIVQRTFLRHSVLAVEGDAAFVKLVQRGRRLQEMCCGSTNKGNVCDLSVREDPRYWPNARCVALHYGLPDGSSTDVETKKFPPASLMAIVSTTSISEGEEVRLCLRSYDRCLDEAHWYEQLCGPQQCCCNTNKPEKEGEGGEREHNTKYCHGKSVNKEETSFVWNVTRGWKRFDMWPDGLPFYHGVGARHAGAFAVAGFPFTLLELAETREIGEGHKGLFAAQPIPYATCFLYCGPAIAAKVVEDRAKRKQQGFNGLTEGSSPTLSMNNDDDSKQATDYNPPNWESTNAAYGVPEDDISIDDDTYALGLGRHGVCFGQGLMRYVNHRYNLNRFGNVELCSVMLSVKSEFSALTRKLEQCKQRAKMRRERAQRVQEKNHKRQQDSNEGSGSPPISRLPRVVAKKAKVSKTKKRKPLFTHSIFLEEYSHFVTIPFFITTADIDIGEQLLAWTYGEEYDARLERQVVCDNHLVPYANAGLLNARLPIARWQRYTGDYRHAINIGDVVWCCRSQDRTKNLFDDLFVVVDHIRSMDCLLMRPIVQSRLPHDIINGILMSFQDTDTDSDDRADQGQENLLVFDVCKARELDRCIIARFDAVALLLADIDYWIVQSSKSLLGPRGALYCRCSCCADGSPTAPSTPNCLPYRIVLRAETLLRNTQLVRSIKDSNFDAPELFNSFVWPLLRAHVSRSGSRKAKGMKQRERQTSNAKSNC